MKNNKDLLIGVAVIALVCGGVFYYSSRPKKMTEEEVTERTRVALAPIAAKLNAEDRAKQQNAAMERLFDLLNAKNNERVAQQIDQAIRDGKVILGMSVREVLQAKGRPNKILDGDEISSEMRQSGVVEMWHYGPEAFVLYGTDTVLFPDWVAFNTDGNVIGATDIKN